MLGSHVACNDTVLSPGNSLLYFVGELDILKTLFSRVYLRFSVCVLISVCDNISMQMLVNLFLCLRDI